jgi:hypothetical protein
MILEVAGPAVVLPPMFRREQRPVVFARRTVLPHFVSSAELALSVECYPNCPFDLLETRGA